MNFLEMAQELAAELDYTEPSTIEGDGLTRPVIRIKRHINRAYSFVWSQLYGKNEETEGETSFATVAGTESYAYPSGYRTVLQLMASDSTIPIRIIPWHEYERYQADTLAITSTGAPTIASVFQAKIYLYPIPDSVYTITMRGQKVLTELAANDDEPALPDDCHRAILEFALMFQMIYEGNPMAGNLLGGAGGLQGQGGQAAIAVATLQTARMALKRHHQEPNRMISRDELGRLNALGRITR